MWKPLSAALLATTLGACASVGDALNDAGLFLESSVSGPAPVERSLAGGLDPAPRPSAASWSNLAIENLETGSIETLSVASASTQSLSFLDPTGCAYTRANDWFSPSETWTNCGTSTNWRDAQASVTTAGSLWPLQVGRTAEYTRRAISTRTGEESIRTTRCEVVDAVRVLRHSGELTPTFKVECDDGRRTRTTWWSPDEGPVFYMQRHERRGLESAWEQLS